MTSASRAAAPPGPHLGLTWRPARPDDLADVVALSLRCDPVDRPSHPFTTSAVGRLMFGGSADPGADTLLGRDDDDVVRAAALVQHERARRSATLWAVLDPAWRGRGVGRALLRWQDARARELLAPAGPGARVQLLVDSHASDRRRLAAAAGFSPAVTYLQLERDLRAQPPDEPRVPDGVHVLGWHADLLEGARQAHLAAFGPDSGAGDAAGWAELCAVAHTPWSFVALTDGVVVGHVLSALDETSAGEPVATTRYLAVRPEARGRGIARALLGTALAAYAAADMHTARLDVDAQNTTGARELYAALGYRRRGSALMYSIEL